MQRQGGWVQRQGGWVQRQYEFGDTRSSVSCSTVVSQYITTCRGIYSLQQYINIVSDRQ